MNTEVQASAQSMLSNAKFYMDYSRWDQDLNRYETWAEAVGRVMNMHRQKYADRMTPRLAELIDFAEEAYANKAVLGSQRALQFGGPQIFKHEAKLYNCLGEETRFVTIHGIRSFQDFNDGDVTMVMSHTGAWRRAVVRNYGKQVLNTVVLQKNRTKRAVRATSNHRWIRHDGTVTTTLHVGDRLFKEPRVFEQFQWDTATIEEQLYWAYGFVYGDGTLNNGYSLVRLCNHKRQYESRFTGLGFKTSSSLSLEGDIIVYTGNYQKTLPDPYLTHPALIRAFTAGYLDADGHRNNNVSGKKFAGIQTSNEESMRFIESMFPVAGIHVTHFTDLEGEVTNYGYRGPTRSYNTCDSSGSKYNAGWKVDAIIPGQSVEDVWCLEVEEDHSFILEGGIVTGNCSFSYADRPEFFSEAMYLLLCGCGVGFSVQTHHIAKLPALKTPNRFTASVFEIEDSIEGWADAFGALLSSYFVDGGQFPQYEGKVVYFDGSKIRPKGALISGGFKAPGPEGLLRSLEKCRELLNRMVADGQTAMRPIDAYDFVMHMADAVLSGGIRRAATICIFSKTDHEMLTAKTGNWFITNPQRGRSNNSALLLRDDLTREEWANIMKSVRDFGEPGFIFSDDTEFGFNPCVEIGMRGYTTDGRSGFQFCNLKIH